ncbi:MAG: hypothetical protein ACRCRZ_01010 [Metamycoplasmataceae bacterium]
MKKQLLFLSPIILIAPISALVSCSNDSTPLIKINGTKEEIFNEQEFLKNLSKTNATDYWYDATSLKSFVDNFNIESNYLNYLNVNINDTNSKKNSNPFISLNLEKSSNITLEIKDVIEEIKMELIVDNSSDDINLKDPIAIVKLDISLKSDKKYSFTEKNLISNNKISHFFEVRINKINDWEKENIEKNKLISLNFEVKKDIKLRDVLASSIKTWDELLTNFQIKSPIEIHGWEVMADSFVPDAIDSEGQLNFKIKLKNKNSSEEVDIINPKNSIKLSGFKRVRI